jgi:hypothetical protein
MLAWGSNFAALEVSEDDEALDLVILFLFASFCLLLVLTMANIQLFGWC